MGKGKGDEDNTGDQKQDKKNGYVSFIVPCEMILVIPMTTFVAVTRHLGVQFYKINFTFVIIERTRCWGERTSVWFLPDDKLPSSAVSLYIPYKTWRP